ncbi:cellulase family glycosylhydrolase [Kiritimatiellota bacterium B12222]|nr:cellulase family glycosylhydrolase [Kiritimatiellota bacterium B12222]
MKTNKTRSILWGICFAGLIPFRLFSDASVKDTKPRDYPKNPEAEAPNPDVWPLELKVKGNRLVDTRGEDVWLQGLAIPGLEIMPEGHGNLYSSIVAVDEWHANVVRLPIKDDYWYGRGGGKYTQTDGGAAYRAQVDAIVIAVANRGAYLVLDHHRYRAVRPEHVTFWQDLAERYKNHPAVLFDIINEPHGITWEVWRNGGEVREKVKVTVDESAFLSEEEKQKTVSFQSPGMQHLVNEIRETGAQNIIIAGGLDWSYDLSGVIDGFALDDPKGNGIMYATHVYPWKRGWQKAFLDVAAHYPIFMGEVGADVFKMPFIPDEAHEDPATWVPDMLGVIQKYRINWTGWSFHGWATPRMILDWEYTPTPFWGALAKEALNGRQFEVKQLR